MLGLFKLGLVLYFMGYFMVGRAAVPIPHFSEKHQHGANIPKVGGNLSSKREEITLKKHLTPVFRTPYLRSRWVKVRRQPALPAEVELSTEREIDLLKLFPPPLRYSLRKTVGWFSALIFITAVYQYLHWNELVESRLRLGFSPLFYAILSVLLIKVFYWECYRKALRFQIKGFRFITRRGVFFRKYASQPILPFGEMFISYNFFDLLCNTRTLQYYTSLDPTKSFLRFDGLTPLQAKQLHIFLSDFLSQQIFVPTDQKATIRMR